MTRGGGGEGASWEFLVGVCHPVFQIKTLFQIKKYNFPHPFSDQTSKIHTRFQTWPLGRNYVLITQIRTQSKKIFKLKVFTVRSSDYKVKKARFYVFLFTLG